MSTSPSTATGPHDDLARDLARAHEAVRERLAELDASMTDMVAASRGSNADDEHDPEGSTIAYERSQLESLIRWTRDQLSEIEEATTRLREGRYGRCEQCGREIGAERLEARPVARTCIACASGTTPASARSSVAHQ